MYRATLHAGFFFGFLPVLILFCTITPTAGQQMQVTDAASAPYTPGNLIPNVFLGEGVEVVNVVFKGAPPAVGYFSNGLQAVGLERGIVLTTGAVESDLTLPFTHFGCDGTGGNFAGVQALLSVQQFDTDLAQLSSGTFWDLTTYTITFVPTADTLRFRYCFASEEYPEYSCSQYNDVFG
ncbi:MAG: choice-of-anchor L domain-containing protein, partial [Thermoanaerobaculia bacterium]|nr:choice-of-anchor L domain-containing protein [Thermoanaerobaculia bacterium]